MIKALDGNPEHIDILAAGTAMRFLTAYLSVTPGTRIITCLLYTSQLPKDIIPLNVIPIGYPAENPLPKDKWKPENIHYNRWTESK